MSQLHQRKRSESSMSDEWETPQRLFDYITGKYCFYPDCDVAASDKNSKCISYYGLDDGICCHGDALEQNWGYSKNWCNPPHSKTEEFVKKACYEFCNNFKETMMIIPANSMTTAYAEHYIEPHAEYHPIFERPKFTNKGEDRDHARNGYFVVIWRKK